MANIIYFGLLLTTITIFSTSTVSHEFDVLKEFDLKSYKVDHSDGSFYRFTSELLKKDFNLNDIFGNQNVEDFTIETVIRFKNNSDETRMSLLRVGNDDNEIDFIHVSSEPNYIRLRLNFYDSIVNFDLTNENKDIWNGKWHKLVISYSKGTAKAWLDCKLVGEENNLLSKINFEKKTSDKLTITLTKANRKENSYKDFDMKTMKIYAGSGSLIKTDECNDVPKSR